MCGCVRVRECMCECHGCAAAFAHRPFFNSLTDLVDTKYVRPTVGRNIPPSTATTTERGSVDPTSGFVDDGQALDDGAHMTHADIEVCACVNVCVCVSVFDICFLHPSLDGAGM
jgi:hypothetical protein